MEKEFITELEDWLKYFNWHRSQIPNAPIERQVEFLLKANYGAIKLIAGLVDQLLVKEQGRAASKHIILPVWTK